MRYREYIKCDDNNAKKLGAYPSWIQRLLNDQRYILYKYIRLLRKEEYYLSKNKWLTVLQRIIIQRKKSSIGQKLGLTIPGGVFREGLVIWHYGNVVVNYEARVGKNAQLHGNNCIGNRGISTGSPIIGDNVDFGFGACVLGAITIADNVKIGANAVVIDSCEIEGATLVGVPARMIKP